MPNQTSQNYTYKALITLLTNLGYSRSQAIDIAFDSDAGNPGLFNDANGTEFVAIRPIGWHDYMVMQAKYWNAAK